MIGQPLPADLPELSGLIHVLLIPDDPINDRELVRAAIPKPSSYLLRPDGHIGLAGTHLHAAALIRYLAERLELRTVSGCKRVAMLVMHFGHPVPEMPSHHATSDYAATVLRPQRRTTMRCDTAPTMTLRRDASPASPVDARLSRAPRLRVRSPWLVDSDCAGVILLVSSSREVKDQITLQSQASDGPKSMSVLLDVALSWSIQNTCGSLDLDFA